MTVEAEPTGFWAYWRKHAWVLLAITSVVLLLETQTSCLAPIESLGIDRFVRVYKRPISPEIFLVEITDKDYEKKFYKRSPLDGKVLSTLLKIIACADPKVIGVDLDTTDTPLPELKCDKRFIWAEVPQTEEEVYGRRNSEETLLFLMPVIKDLRDYNRLAMPQFPQDEDGVVRRFADNYSVLDGHSRATINAMPCALASAALPNEISCQPRRREFKRFSVSGDHFQFQVVDASEILENPPKAGGPFTGKIVLVGGNYRAARDSYVTPAGEMAGVEVIANAAQSYLPGGGAVREAPPYWGAIFDLLTGTFVVWLYWYFRDRLTLAFRLSITAAPLVVMAVSFLLFLTIKHWLGFLPVMLGMVIHLLHDYAETLREKQEPREEKPEGEMLIFERISYWVRLRSRYPRPDR